ncbi:MAG TPA: hypothetical protein VHK00_06465 [Miltoncostaeaceae bacterium]|jgi:hypothetical protein|nr:hypothetical protein [Miltoncostaeaceae bacterium]
MPELRWATQGHVGSVVLSNNGRPFRTVSGGAARRYRVAAGVIVPADG